MTPQIEEACRLLRLAKADRDAFLWMLQGEALRPATVFFFAQLATEKALKAVMIAHDLVPTRTHDLLALAAEINSMGITTPVSPDELAILNPYAVTFRYDDDELSLLQPEHARAMVNLIIDWSGGQVVPDGGNEDVVKA